VIARNVKSKMVCYLHVPLLPCTASHVFVLEEGTPSPVRALIPKTIDSTQAFSYSSAPPEEDRHVKRQRRLIKNRESAQLSRMRKKIYIDDLERKVSVLTQDNDILTKRVASLVNDNLQLSEKVNNLTNILKQNQTQRKSVATNASTTNKNLKTAGVCMLMILFSFGLFFNIKGGERYREQ
jgi:regulator of replication initiation timing